jgi:hypothetical protein
MSFSRKLKRPRKALLDRHSSIHRWSLRIAALLLIITLLWGAWYVNTRGFTKKWRGYVKQEFLKRGFEIEFDRLTLDPFRGLVARNVTFITSRGEGTPRGAGRIGQIALDVNYASLIRGVQFLNAADLRDTNLIIPLEEGQEPLEIKNLSARVFFPGDEILIRQLRADLHDVRINAELRLIHPHTRDAVEVDQAVQHEIVDAADRKLRQAPDPLPRRLRDYLHLLNIEAAKFEAKAGHPKPMLHLRLQADTRNLSQLNSEISFSGRDFLRDGIAYERAEALLWMNAGTLALKNLRLVSSGRTLEGGGTFQFADHTGRLRLISELHLNTLAREFGEFPILREVVFYQPPRIEALVNVNLRKPDPIQVIGKMRAERTLFRSVLFEEVTADFGWHNPRKWMITNGIVRHRTGRAELAARKMPDDFRFSLDCAMAGEAVVPIMGGHATRFLADWEFLDTPRLTLRVHGPNLNLPEMEYTGSLEVGRARFRGKWIRNAGTRLRGNHEFIEYRDFYLQRAEGEARGTVRYPLDNSRRVSFENVTSTIDVRDGAAWFGNTIERAVKPYRFVKAPRLHIDGVADFSTHPSTDLLIRLEAPEGLSWRFFDKPLHFTEVSSLIFLKDGQLGIKDATAAFHGGRADLNLLVKLMDSHRRGYAGKLELTGTDLPPLSRLVWPDSPAPECKLDATVSFHNAGTDPRRFQATGAVKLSEGNLLELPLLGQISRPLKNFAGRFLEDDQEEASLVCEFLLKDQLLSTEELRCEVGDLTLVGSGTYSLTRDDLSMVLRARSHTLAEGLLSPFSNLLSFRGTGTLREPEWKLQRFIPPPQERIRPRPEVYPIPPRRPTTRQPRNLPRAISRP